MISKKKDSPICEIFINGERIKQVETFKYLGSWFTSDAKSETDIKTKIGMAKTAFAALKHILTNRHITMKTKIRVLECYVWPVMLYGAETWTISKAMKKTLEAAEMWFLRKMMKISWTEKKTNELVLEMAGTQRKLMSTICKRQLQVFGHIMRKNGIENLVTTGKVEGKRSRGRQRMTYISSLLTDLKGVTSELELIQSTNNREKWKSIVVNVEIHDT